MTVEGGRFIYVIPFDAMRLTSIGFGCPGRKRAGGRAKKNMKGEKTGRLAAFLE